MKSISLIGSTGSIGRQTCSVVRRHREEFRIVSLVANTSAELFLRQVEEFRPEFAALIDEEAARSVRGKIPAGTRFSSGIDGGMEALTYGDTAVIAATGFVGLK